MLNGGSDTFYASHHYYKKIKVNKCRSHSSCFCKPSLMLLIWSMTGGEMKCRIKEYTHLNQQLLPVTKQLSSPLLKSGCWCLHMMNKRFLKRKLQRISVVAMISTICLEPRSQRGHRHKTREIWDIWEPSSNISERCRLWWLRCRDPDVLGMMAPENKQQMELHRMIYSDTL